MSSENRSPGTMLTRRNAIKAGVGAGAAAVGVSSVTPPAVRPVQESEALAFTTAATVYAAAVAGGMALGWAAREYEVLGSDDVPDGLGPNTLQQQMYIIGQKRQSVNQSTITDNKNIIGYMDETAYSEGKLAALEAIDNGATQAEAITAGQDAAESHMATVEKNYLKSWNESASEVENLDQAATDHSNLDSTNVIYFMNDNGYSDAVDIRTTSHTLRDGSSFETLECWYDNPNHWDATGFNDGAAIGGHWVAIENPDGGTLQYMDKDTYSNFWTDMQTKFDDILNNISLFVDNTYDKIQTGEISPGEYLSATDLANTIATDDERAMAIADLIAMNIPGDYGTPVTIELLEDNTKISGYLASTDPGEYTPLSAGVTIDPNAHSGTWYFAYLPETAISTIPATQYNESYGIQAGEFNLWTDPRNTNEGYDVSGNLSYMVDTTHGETAEVTPSEFNQTTNASGGTIWKADINDRLNQSITEIAQIRTVSKNPTDQYMTLNLDQEFKVVDVQGADSIEIQQNRDPQTDTNYITDEEWQQILDQQEQLIEEYEDAADSSGGGWSPSFDVPTVGPLDSIEDWGLAAIAAVIGSAVFGNLS